ncbi:unnamed protein product [Arabis nemorensis]|uniref:Knottin scorpion toxin-like domain-containing protein n=1 Tax=Arabis nemorensis TaxID=586526 RepID=A0A565AUX3_9BRAS|nr:unnamed protein product [Arabis nemorensis]
MGAKWNSMVMIVFVVALVMAIDETNGGGYIGIPECFEDCIRKQCGYDRTGACAERCERLCHHLKTTNSGSATIEEMKS